MNIELLNSFLSPEIIIKTLGTLGVIVVIFLETGAFFGFFLPGDSLLFTAGFLASQGYVSFAWLLVGVFLAAAVGDSVGYAFGKKVGSAIFTKDESVLFNKRHVARAQHFYEKHGAKTIILARFIPIVRTFAPIVAGVGNMRYGKFLLFNLLGGFLWTWSMLWFGYGLGALIPNPDKYVLPIILVIVTVSAFPVIREIARKAFGNRD